MKSTKYIYKKDCYELVLDHLDKILNNRKNIINDRIKYVFIKI